MTSRVQQLLLAAAVCAGAAGRHQARDPTEALVLFTCDVGRTRVYALDSRSDPGGTSGPAGDPTLGAADDPATATGTSGATRFGAHVLVTDVAALHLGHGGTQCVRELVVSGFSVVLPDGARVGGSTADTWDTPATPPPDSFAAAAGSTASGSAWSRWGIGGWTGRRPSGSVSPDSEPGAHIPAIVFVQNATGGIVEVAERRRWNAGR